MPPGTSSGRQTHEHSGPLHEKAAGGPLRRRWLIPAVALIVVAALLASGIWSRVKVRKNLNAETAQVAVTAVSVVQPKPATPTQEIILPGNVQPYITSPIYSRTNGYLRK